MPVSTNTDIQADEQYTPEALSAEKLRLENEMSFAKRCESQTVYDQLCKTCERFPANPAVSFQIKSDDGYKAQTLSWRELKKQVTQAANFFRTLSPQETPVIAYLLPATNETIITLMGGMTAGIVSPINPLLESEQIASILKQTGASVLVTLKSFPNTDIAQKAVEAVAMAPNVKSVVEIDLRHHLQAPIKWLVPFVRPKVSQTYACDVYPFQTSLAKANGKSLDFSQAQQNDVCAYFHTGGTTGMPKIAQHKHLGILYNGWANKNMFFTENDCVICPLPFFHVFAAHPIWMGCVASGAHLILPTPAGARGEGVIANFWKLVERWQCTVMISVPTMMAILMQKPLNANISSLKTSISGSAPLPTELFTNFEENTGVKIIEGYGMTEATCLVSCNPPNGKTKIGSVGIPIPYCDVKILQINTNNELIKHCEIDEIGEICVSNPGVLAGETYTDPAKNKNTYIEEHYFRTGDLGRLDNEGYLWITGRAKDLIIRGGHNIDPAIIEEALCKHPMVAFVGAIGQPDARSGEIPCAYVELTEQAYMNKSVSISELVEFCKEHIFERAAIPKYIEIMQELPKTAVGKVFKPDLRKKALTRVYNKALRAAQLDVVVNEVIDDKKKGLIAELSPSPNVSDEAITNVLGKYTRPWRWQQ